MKVGVRQYRKDGSPGRYKPTEYAFTVSFKGKSASPLEFYYWCLNANLAVVLHEDVLHFEDDAARTFFYMNFPVFK